MHHPVSLAARSGSLSTLSSQHCIEARRGSEPMHTPSAGPLTPPLSPVPGGPEDANGSTDEDREDIVVDAEPRFSGPDGVSFVAPTYLQPLVDRMPSPEPSEDENMEEMTADTADTSASTSDATMNTVEAASQSQPKTLDDEASRVHKSTSLKLRDLEVKGTLGTGTFGRVLLVRLKSSTPAAATQNYFALKVLRKTEIVRLRQVEHVNAERYILSRVRHPFIVDLFATFQDSLNIYMLLSFVPGGELFTHLRRAQRFTPDVTRFYLATIVLALKYLHSFNIIYRDLKPENLLLDSRGYLRLTDFGFAKIVDDRTWTLCGTPEYLAPEIVLSDGHGKAADWWSCGILAYEMMVGYPPFFDPTAYGIYQKILYSPVLFPKDVDTSSRELVKSFLVKDKSKRLGNMGGGAQDVLDHSWFRGVDWDALERREIRAPIIPHVTSPDDTRHFLHLPHPPLEEIPGLVREETPPPLTQRFDPVSYQFLEF